MIAKDVAVGPYIVRKGLKGQWRVIENGKMLMGGSRSFCLKWAKERAPKKAPKSAKEG
jgi:hypothetical protein